MRLLTPSAGIALKVARHFYAAPILEGTTRTYTITPDGANVLVECDAVTVPDATYSKSDMIHLNVSNSINVILEFPEPLIFSGLRLDNSKNVIITSDAPEGVCLKAYRAADADLRAMLRITGTQGELWVNNVFIDCDEQDGLDALIFGSFGYQDPTPLVTVQNFRAINLWNDPNNSLHSDGLQFYGGAALLRVANVDITTNGQGMFLPPQIHNVGGIDLRNVSIDYTDPLTAHAYALYLEDPNQSKVVPIRLNNVYIGERDPTPNYYPAETWETYSIFPHAQMTGGAVLDGDTASWPAHPEITGHVTKWNGERFAPSTLGQGVTFT